jgi:hypothetical protein
MGGNTDYTATNFRPAMQSIVISAKIPDDETMAADYEEERGGEIGTRVPKSQSQSLLTSFLFWYQKQQLRKVGGKRNQFMDKKKPGQKTR